MGKLRNYSTDILIIGAGMSGMAAATDLARAGRRVMVVDKGRDIGGRMASRRIGEAVLITVRNSSPPGAIGFRKACGNGAKKTW